MKLMPNFGDAGFKGFLFAHAEKFAMGVVGLIALYMVYTGWASSAADKYPKDPSELKGKVTAATTNIDRPTWNTVVAKSPLYREPDFDKRVQAVDVKIRPDSYSTTMPWNPSLFASRNKRIVPEVYEPIKVEVKPGYGAMAVDPLDPLNKNVPTLGGEQKKKDIELARKQLLDDQKKDKDPKDGPGVKPKPGNERPNPKPPAGAKAQPPKVADKGKEKGKNPNDDINALIGGGAKPVPGVREGARAGMAAPGMVGGPGMGVAGAQGDPGAISFRADRSSLAKGDYFMSVTALVPYKKQWENFEDCFKEATDFDPVRDVPKYTYPIIERQEENGKWVTLSRSDVLSHTETFVAAADEVADPRYVHPKLTAPLPPLLVRDLRTFALHSEVPAIAAEQLVEKEGDEPGMEEDKDKEKKSDVDLDDDPDPLPGGKKGPKGGIGAMAGVGVGRNPGAPKVGMRAPGMRGEGVMAGVGGVGGVSADRPKVDYLLLRFFDYSVQPGKKYKYRVKVRIEDPNNPPEAKVAGGGAGVGREQGGVGGGPGGPGDVADKSNKPRDLALDETVIADRERRKAEMTKLGRSTKDVEKLIHYLESKASVESEAVSIQPEPKLLAGPIAPPKDKNAEAQAKFVIIDWYHRYAVDVPVEIDAARGVTLNMQKDAEVVDPIENTPIKVEKYSLNSDVVLLDLRGGEPLPGSDKKNPTLSSAQMLFVDAKGQLVVRKELDDQEEFHRYVPEVVKEKVPVNGQPAGNLPIDGPGGLKPPVGPRPPKAPGRN